MVQYILPFWLNFTSRFHFACWTSKSLLKLISDVFFFNRVIAFSIYPATNVGLFIYSPIVYRNTVSCIEGLYWKHLFQHTKETMPKGGTFRCEMEISRHTIQVDAPPIVENPCGGGDCISIGNRFTNTVQDEYISFFHANKGHDKLHCHDRMH